jgi:hypothetical protein
MKINWGAGIAIFYILFVAAMIIFVVKSTRQKNELVIDDYYTEAVSYQKIINESNNALNAESKLKMEFITNESAIYITTDGNEKKIPGILTFYKPDNAANDFRANFITDNSGNANIPLKNIKHGYWKVGLSWTSAGKECFETHNIFFKNP